MPRFLIPLLALALSACTRHTIPHVALIPQTHMGPAQDFGPGIVDATPEWVKFDLDQPAYVIGFRMTDDGGIAKVWNTAKLGRGTYVASARGRRRRPPPSLNDDGYWLVIVSDIPTPPHLLDQRLESIMLADPPLKDALQSLPVVLVSSRTGHWAAYSTTFGTPMDHP